MAYSINYNTLTKTLTVSGDAIPDNFYKTAEMTLISQLVNKLIIDTTIESIGNNAFLGCNALSTIIFKGSSSCAFIGNNAFENCGSLAAIELPESIMTIGARAFYNCLNLSIVTIPDGITSIGDSAFYGCNNIETATIPALAIDHIKIRENLNIINITSGDSIPDRAFYGCSHVTEVTLANSIKTIGEEAFYGCISLKKFNSSKVGNIDLANLKTIREKAFYNCRNLIAAYITNYIDIKEEAFKNCYKLVKVVDTNNVLQLVEGSTARGYIAYYALTLEDLPINEGTLTIGSNTYLVDLDVNQGKIPDSVTHIHDYVGVYSDIETLKIPVGIRVIGDYAFSDCQNLKKIVFEGSDPIVLGAETFKNCPKITTVIFAKNDSFKIGLTSWCKSSFGYRQCLFANNPEIMFYLGDQKLETIDSSDFDSSITEIPDYAFANYKFLQSVILPSSITKIGMYAFYNCSNLQVLTLNNVTSIGMKALNGCDSLIYDESSPASNIKTLNNGLWVIGGSDPHISECTIPANCKYIYYNAFKDCTDLKKIYYNSNSTITASINNWAGITFTSLYSNPMYPSEAQKEAGIRRKFYLNNAECTTAIINNVEEIKPYAFSGFTFDSLTIIGNPIIGKDAFLDCLVTSANISTSMAPYIRNPQLTSVTISQGTTLPSKSFINCTSLNSVEFSTVSHFGINAFAGCTKIQRVNYNNDFTMWNNITFENESANPLWNLKTSETELYIQGENYIKKEELILSSDINILKSYALLNFTNLKSITITSDIQEIEPFWIIGCTGLKEIKVKDGVNQTKYDFISTEAGSYVIEKATNTVVLGTAGSYSIQEGPIAIADNAFYGCDGLTEIVIPTSIQTIGKNAFYRCSGLKKITIPFVGASLKENEINTHFGYLFGASSYKNNEDYVPKALKEVVVSPKADVRIAAHAFEDCISITTLALPETLSYVGDYAFKDCASLIYTEENGIKYLGANKLILIDGTGCTKTELTLGATKFIYSEAFKNNTTLQTVSGDLTDRKLALISIGYKAFYGCTSLTNINLSAITQISDYAFYNCTSLKSINLEGLISIGKQVLFNCTTIEELSIPSTLEEANISWQAFYGMKNLKTLSMPAYVSTYIDEANIESLTIISGDRIKDAAFKNCKKLKSVKLPASLTIIGQQAFLGCILLQNINLENTQITIIDANAFRDCTSLLSIMLPESLETISINAFLGCHRLVEVYNNSTNINLECGSSENGCVAQYAIALNPASSIIKIVGEKYSFIEKDGTKMLLDCSDRTSAELKLPEMNEAYKVYKYAFINNDAIKKINLTDVTVINEMSFYSCSNLETVIAPKLKTIGPSAFSKCKALTKITNNNTENTGLILTEPLEKIEENAFINCGLKNVTLYGSTTFSLEGNVFKNCPIDEFIVIGDSLLYEVINKCLVKKETKELISAPQFDTVDLTGTSIKAIGTEAFVNNKLGSIKLPSNLTLINAGAFEGCENLSSAVFANTLNWNVYKYPDDTESGILIDISDASIAATYLTSTYKNYYWKHNE